MLLVSQCVFVYLRPTFSVPLHLHLHTDMHMYTGALHFSQFICEMRYDMAQWQIFVLLNCLTLY